MTSSEGGFPEEAEGQDQRVWALIQARKVLLRGPFGGGEISTVDLIDLSMFILTGEDPYTRTQDQVT